MTLLGLVVLMTLMDLVVALPAALLTSFPLLPSLPFLSRVTLSRVTTLFISVSSSRPPLMTFDVTISVVLNVLSALIGMISWIFLFFVFVIYCSDVRCGN